jgi:16S rRNA (uracil1498-N3)-methyltransferase
MSHDFLFYLAHVEENPARLELEGGEHHHLAAVLRIRPGERVFVTDGAGRLFECQVSAVERSVTRLEVTGRAESGRPAREITLALSCIRKERFERAVEQCTELGMARCIPFASSPAVLKRFGERYIERLRAIALSAMKQSFGSIMPVIDSPIDFEGLLSRLDGPADAVVGSQEAGPLDAGGFGRRVLIIVGPEAGFSDEETESLRRAGCAFASVSARRLRSETAAAALVSMMNRPARGLQSD